MNQLRGLLATECFSASHHSLAYTCCSGQWKLQLRSLPSLPLILHPYFDCSVDALQCSSLSGKKNWTQFFLLPITQAAQKFQLCGASSAWMALISAAQQALSHLLSVHIHKRSAALWFLHLIELTLEGRSTCFSSGLSADIPSHIFSLSKLVFTTA